MTTFLIIWMWLMFIICISLILIDLRRKRWTLWQRGLGAAGTSSWWRCGVCSKTHRTWADANNCEHD